MVLAKVNFLTTMATDGNHDDVNDDSKDIDKKTAVSSGLPVHYPNGTSQSGRHIV